MNYKVLNKMSVMDIPADTYETEIERHNEESDSILASHGINDKDDIVIRRKDGEIEVNCVYDAIQGMSIKEGVDIVQFEDGKIGFVAYYGTYTDYFVILGKAESTIKDYIDILWNEIERVTVEDTDGNEIVEVCKEDIECGEIEDYENSIVVDFWTYDGNPNAKHIVLTIEEE